MIISKYWSIPNTTSLNEKRYQLFFSQIVVDNLRCHCFVFQVQLQRSKTKFDEDEANRNKFAINYLVFLSICLSVLIFILFLSLFMMKKWLSLQIGIELIVRSGHRNEVQGRRSILPISRWDMEFIIKIHILIICSFYL